MYNDILDFCFNEAGSKKFFEKDLAFDKLLIERYSDILEQAAAAEFYTWRSSIQGRLAEKLFKQYTNADTIDTELKHKVIIDRFGRYPHRNDILGRVSSSEEIEFLTQPDSSFL